MRRLRRGEQQASEDEMNRETSADGWGIGQQGSLTATATDSERL